MGRTFVGWAGKFLLQNCENLKNFVLPICLFLYQKNTLTHSALI